MTIATKLSEARKLIERGWCQGDYARNAAGKQVDESCDAAVCFCITGALHRVFPQPRPYSRAKDLLRMAVGRDPIVWNDTDGRTQAEVIEAFKRAEQLARDGAE